jgi:ABC-type nitrate/sulfonate/bicarbonate transport system permease component
MAAKWKRMVLGLWFPAALLLGWQWAATFGIIDPLFFPPPSTLLAEGGKMIQSGELGRHLQATLIRALGGFLAGSLAGLGFGLVMGASRRLRESAEPTLSALFATPKLSLFPMLLLLFGVGDTAKIVLIALSTFILVAFHALDAVLNINAAYVEMAANYGARRRDLLRLVYLPACMPQIFTGLRLALSRSLVSAISVELISAQDGLGSLIFLSWQTLATDRLYVAISVAATLGVLLHVALRKAEQRLLAWRGSDGGA